jgi:hypothetical protein
MAETQRRPDYRAAAELALKQLDWCANYLHRIRKDQLARQVSRNCAEIRRRMAEDSRDAQRT